MIKPLLLCMAVLLPLASAHAGLKTESNITILKTGSNSLGASFIQFLPNTSLTGVCNGNWARVADEAMMSNILAAVALKKIPTLVTIENAALGQTVNSPTGPVSTTCRVEWIEFNYQ